jgi:hypothetical protein
MLKLRLVVLTAFVFASASVFAAPAAPTTKISSAKKYRAGIMLGMGIPTSDAFGPSRLVYGVDFYMEHDAKFDFGVSYTGSSTHHHDHHHHHHHDHDYHGHSHVRLLGGELNYKLPHIAAGFYVGASAGFSTMSADDGFIFPFFPGFDDIYFGPKAGIWRPISPDFSLGFESKFLLVTSSPEIAWLQLLGAVRLHF